MSLFSRRQFLGAAAGTVGASAVGSLRAQAASGTTIPSATFASPPSGDTTGATDSAMFDSLGFGAGSPASPGTVLMLSAAPPSAPYYVKATLVVPDYCGIIGQGRDSTTVRAADRTNLAAVVASAAYLGTGSVSSTGNPIRIEHVTIDCNNANNPTSGDGIIVMNWRSIVEHNRVLDPLGNGITISDQDQAGGLNSNDQIEMRITENWIDNPGNRGIWVNNGGSQASLTTDCYLIDNVVNNPSGDWAMRIECAAGWFIRGNHVYHCQQNGILLANVWCTFFEHNEIAHFGEVGAATTYTGLQTNHIIEGRPSIFNGNVAGAEEVAGASYIYYDFQVAQGVNQNIALGPNVAHTDSGAGTSESSTAFRFLVAAGSTLTVKGAGQLLIDGPTTAYTSGGGGDTVFPDVVPGAGLAVTYEPYTGQAANELIAGDSTVPRLTVSNDNVSGFKAGDLILTYFTASRSETVTQIKVVTGATAQVGATLIRLGLFTVDAAGNLTLAASTVSDTSLLAAPSTTYAKALSASYTKVQGQRYAIGILIVGATTMPSLIGNNSIRQPGYASSPRLLGNVPSQKDLPAIQAVKGIVATRAAAIYSEIIP